MAESSKREITGKELGGKQEAVERACRMAGLSKGDPIVVEWQGEAYIYRCEGTAAENSGGDIPNCPVSLCEKYQRQINEFCHQPGWPPGAPILIYQGDDSFCYCYCR